MSAKITILTTIRKSFRNRLCENILRSMIRSNTIFSILAEKLTPNYLLYKPKTNRTFKSKGINLNADISDYIGHFNYFEFKDNATIELLRIAKGKKVILDIGANIGFTALNLAQSSDSNSIVYAFEPDPYNYSRLITNLNLNPTKNVSPENIGIGDKEENLKLAIDTINNLGGNRINQNATENYSIIPVTTVDIFIQKGHITNVDLMKIDIEGFEMHALKGAEQTIKQFKPILFIEVNNENLKNQNSSAKELIQFLEQYYSIIYDAESKKEISSNENFEGCHIDIVATNSK